MFELFIISILKQDCTHTGQVQW